LTGLDSVKAVVLPLPLKRSASSGLPDDRVGSKGNDEFPKYPIYYAISSNETMVSTALFALTVTFTASAA
jgi:hypothetical protein